MSTVRGVVRGCELEVPGGGAARKSETATVSMRQSGASPALIFKH